MRSLVLGRPVVVVLVLMVSAGLAATSLSVVGTQRSDERAAQDAAALASTPPTLNAVGDPGAALGCSCGRVLLHVELPPGGDRVVVTRDDGTVVHDGPGGDLVDGWLGDGLRVSYTAIAYGADGVVSPAATAAAETPDRTPPPVPGAPSGSGYPLQVTWPGGQADAAYTLRRDGAEVGAGRGTPIADPDAVDTAAPAAPRGLSAEPVGADVRVRWEPVVDAGTRHDYAVRAADESGNASEWSPSTTIAVASGVARYRVTVDDAAPVDVVEPTIDLPGLRPGSTHDVEVVAVDAAGNASPPSAPLSITVAQPAAPAGVEVVQDGSTVSVEPDAGTTVVGVEISPGDGEPYVPVDGTSTALPDGTYDVRVEVEDDAGQTSTTTEQVVVDTTSPVVVASWSGSAGGDGTLTIQATDAVGIVSLELDGRPIKRVRRSRFSVDLGRPHVVVASDRGGHRTKVRIAPQKGKAKGKAKGTKRAGGTRTRR
ncbi:MAG: hypothetical protein R3C15_17065 [Thermoleophilia bacterium]